MYLTSRIVDFAYIEIALVCSSVVNDHFASREYHQREIIMTNQYIIHIIVNSGFSMYEIRTFFVGVFVHVQNVDDLAGNYEIERPEIRRATTVIS